MIDNLVLALTHGLMLLAAWRLLSRPDAEDGEPRVFPASKAHLKGSATPSPSEGKDRA
jgi:hypothetical protein